jgi:hypothetical protein
LNDIIIHSEEEEVDESFIEEDNFIMKQKTIVSEKKINKKDYSLNTTNSNVTNSKQKKRTKCHKSNSFSDSGEISSNKNVDYIKHSYSLLRKLSNLLKKRKVCMTNTNTNNTSNTSNCTNKKPNKHPHNESFSSRHNMTTPSNKDKNNLSHTNNNNNTTNKNFSPNSNRSYCIKESDFHINLHKLTTDNNNNTHNNSSNKYTHTKHNSINNSQITQSSTSLSETCDSSISQQPKTRKTKHKHTSNTNINSSIKPKPPLYSNRKSFVDHPTSFHAKIFAESS